MQPMTLTPAMETWAQRYVLDTKSSFQQAKDLMHGLRQLRFMRTSARPSKPYQRLVAKNVHAPLAYALGQTATGSIARSRPTWLVSPRTNSPEDVTLAESLSVAGDLLFQTYERFARKPLYWKFLDQCVCDGMGVYKFARIPWINYPLREQYDDNEEFNAEVDKFLESRPPIPLRARLVDPLTIFPPTSEVGAPVVMESALRPSRETFRSLGLQERGSKLIRIPEGQPYDLREPPPAAGTFVEVSEIWSEEEVIFVIGAPYGQVFAFENDASVFAGKLPYSWASGEVSGLDDPAVANLSVLFPLMYLQPWMDTLLAMMVAWAAIGANPSAWTSRDVGAGVHEPGIKISDFQPGKVYSLGTGGRMGFLEPPSIGREAIRLLEMFISLSDRVGLAPIVSGIIGTRTPGLTQSAAMEAAISKLSPVVDNAEFCLADALKLSFHAIENVIQKPVWVSGWQFEEANQTKKKGSHRISPADIKGHYDISCSLKVDTLQDVIAKGTHAAFMNNAQLWGHRRSMQFSGVQNVSEEEDSLLKDKVAQLPVVQAFLATIATQNDPILNAFAAFLAQSGIAPEQLLTGELDLSVLMGGMGTEGEPAGPGQGLGRRNLGGQPKRGGGRSSGQPTQRPRGPR